MAARPKDRTADYFMRSGDFKPPETLPKAAQTLWGQIMATTPEDQWRPGDLPC